jgi:vancomycin resistance protein YoaR
VVSGPADKEEYGILALLGEGVSTFKGSGAGRIHNLTLAAERTNGVLVAPGAVYSMNNSIGAVEASTGYDIAYIIQEGRTVLGSGGGVCQTSTTIFRAVLNSGLPVVMRHAHAYRVSYYEQNMKVGFDAAVFQPTWDFQFKNDTPNYILVQSFANLEESSLTFRIFGTSDGRTVQISEPEVTNQSPPPPALYQDDPTLAKGVTKQVDFPAWGASVKFTRTVKRGDKVLFEDVFSSRYQAWRAVYLVGTKE